MLSQQHGEAGGSSSREMRVRTESSPDNDGTRWHCQTAPVRHWPTVSVLSGGDDVEVTGRWSMGDPRDGGWVLIAVAVERMSTSRVSMTLPDAMTPGSPRAERLLAAYFTERRKRDRQPAFTGAMFERPGGGGDRAEVANRFTAEDIVAVSMLSVNVPPRAALRILGADAPVLSRLLAAIPADVDMVDADDLHLAANSPADELWHHLVGYADVGWVTAGKLLARKRPRLLPVLTAWWRRRCNTQVRASGLTCARSFARRTVGSTGGSVRRANWGDSAMRSALCECSTSWLG